MPLDFLGNIFGSAISAAASYANTKQVNATNLKIAQETNAANREMVEMQNKAAAAESEKAYNRSKASNQVGLMMSAGMSRAGAINALNGGGSYTPAPVNTSQDSAPQMQTADLSALANIGQGLAAISQRKHEEKMAKMQISAQKEENAANRENAKEIAEISADASKYGADSSSSVARERLEWDKKVYEDAAPLRKRQLEELDYRIKNLDAQTNNTKVQTALYDLEYELSAENLDIKKIRNLASDLESISQSQLNTLMNESRRNAIETLDSNEFNLYMQYKMRMELVSLISTAIKDQEWNSGITNKKNRFLKLIGHLLVRK